MAAFARIDGGFDAVDRTTYTDTLVVSAGGAERTFVLVVGGRATAVDRVVSSATLGGAAGTIDVQHTVNDGSNSTVSAILRFSAADMTNPDGTSLALSLTFAGGMVRAHWDLYETADAIAALVHDTAQESEVLVGGPYTIDLDVDVGTSGAVIAGATCGSFGGAGAAAWTGLTEDVEQGFENNFYSAASLPNGAQELARNISVDLTGVHSTCPSAVGVAASYAPTAGQTTAPGDIAQAQALGAPAATQTHIVSPGGIAQAQVLDPPPLTQDHELVVADLVQLQVLEAAGIVQTQLLSPVDIAQLQVLTSSDGLPTLEKALAVARVPGPPAAVVRISGPKDVLVRLRA